MRDDGTRMDSRLLGRPVLQQCVKLAGRDGDQFADFVALGRERCEGRIRSDAPLQIIDRASPGLQFAPQPPDLAGDHGIAQPFRLRADDRQRGPVGKCEDISHGSPR